MVLGYTTVIALCIGPFLLLECDAPQAHFQEGLKLVFRQVALIAQSFDSTRVQDQHGGCPTRIEAMEPRRVLLDMGLYRNEVVVDKACYPFIRIRLGLQPSTCPSSRRRAEIYK